MPIERRLQHTASSSFWQLALLTAGVGGLWMSHTLAGSAERNPGSVLLPTVIVVLAALAALGRGTQLMVVSGFSDMRRVFRSRHLLACGGMLFAAGALVALPIATGRPFRSVFAHGRITGGEVADIGSMSGTVLCAVGAIVAAVGAWDSFQDERHWHRSLGIGGRPHR